MQHCCAIIVVAGGAVSSSRLWARAHAVVVEPVSELELFEIFDELEEQLSFLLHPGSQNRTELGRHDLWAGHGFPAPVIHITQLR